MTVSGHLGFLSLAELADVSHLPLCERSEDQGSGGARLSGGSICGVMCAATQTTSMTSIRLRSACVNSMDFRFIQEPYRSLFGALFSPGKLKIEYPALAS